MLSHKVLNYANSERIFRIIVIIIIFVVHIYLSHSQKAYTYADKTYSQLSYYLCIVTLLFRQRLANRMCSLSSKTYGRPQKPTNEIVIYVFIVEIFNIQIT